jgi:hypothetical protein
VFTRQRLVHDELDTSDEVTASYESVKSCHVEVGSAVYRRARRDASIQRYSKLPRLLSIEGYVVGSRNTAQLSSSTVLQLVGQRRCFRGMMCRPARYSE